MPSAYDDEFWGGAGTPPDYGGTGGGYQGGPGYQGQGNFGSDPFGYTGGSMLTPWTQPFTYAGQPSHGGIAMDPFHYADFAYSYRAPGAYGGQEDIAPDYFGYGEFQSPEQFKAPTEADLAQDPSYQFRLKQGQDAALASAASRGLARTGGFAKALADYNQQAASQEYGNVYQRKAAEYDRNAALARQDWATRRQNAADQNAMNYQRRAEAVAANNATRLAAYNANVDSSIRGQQLGYDIASGTYDRNLQNAKDAYNSALQIAQANASAGAANEQEAYNRALQQYGMAYDMFNTNQDRQWNRIMQGTQLGMGAADRQAGYGSEYGDRQGSTYGQAANAQAGSRMAGANAWANALGGISDAAIAAYGYSQYGKKNPSGPPVSPNPGPAPPPPMNPNAPYDPYGVSNVSLYPPTNRRFNFSLAPPLPSRPYQGPINYGQ